MSRMARRSACISLWLFGLTLRLTILAVPPVLPLIRRDLGLSGTQVGILSAIPIMLFALAAVPGSLLISKLGVTRTLLSCALAASFGAGMRAFVRTPAELFAATALMGLGIAAMQPAMGVAVRRWMPERVSFASAVYANGLIAGQIIPASLMLPLVLPAARYDWRTALALWAVPTTLAAATAALLAPRAATWAPATPWWPRWRNADNWRIGLMVGSVNSLYFGSNTFIPAHLSNVGRSDLVGTTLTILNTAQLPGSIFLILVSARLAGRIWPYLFFPAAGIVGVVGIASSSNALVIWWAAAIGLSSGTSIGLALALIPLICAPEEITRTSAAAFSVSFSYAMLTTLVAGASWDLTSLPSVALVVIAASATPIFPLSRFLSRVDPVLTNEPTRS